MGIITLTDRISVSVRAKNNTEKSAQNKATGANIQKALGGSGLSDTDLEEIGNVDSITDENGNEWIKMEDIIAAGRKMKEKGAFDGKEIHEGLTDTDGTVYNFSPVYEAGGVELYAYPDRKTNPSDNDTRIIFTDYQGNRANCYVAFLNTTSYGNAVFFSKEDFYIWVQRQQYRNGIWSNASASGGDGDAYSVTIGDITYSFYYLKLGSASAVPYIPENGYASITPFNNKTYYVKDAAGYLFGPTHTSGGSIIDWDAPNAEVERQIKELHETWDVSDHPGASGQGIGAGTYILAGPIEFNDGD